MYQAVDKSAKKIFNYEARPSHVDVYLQLSLINLFILSLNLN